MSEYADRNHMALGDHYVRHVSAMTAEGLHRKSDIAAELAWRDAEIERLRAQVAACAPAPAPAEVVAWLQSYMCRGHTYKRLFLASEFPDMGGRQLAPGVTVVPLYAAPAAPAGWQPIETAPKEGQFLVYTPNNRRDKIQAATWHPNVKIIGNVFAFDTEQPTHWMPLPAAPGAQGDAS